jgi:hypothetical protein
LTCEMETVDGACARGGNRVCATAADCPAGDESVARGGAAQDTTLICRVPTPDASAIVDTGVVAADTSLDLDAGVVDATVTE